MTDVLLRAESISKKFGGIAALQNVSLEVQRGELLAVVGPNGSGKTTLLSILLGVVTPTTGSVVLQDHDVTNIPPYGALRRGLSATFQTPRIFETLTVAENAELGLRAKNAAPRAIAERVHNVLCSLNLESKASHPAYALSVGQRKLLEFRRAVICQPAILLLDEPSAGVHPKLLEVFSSELRAAADKGMAAVVVSHDLPWIFALCSRVLVLRMGQVWLEGPPESVRVDQRLVEAYLA